VDRGGADPLTPEDAFSAQLRAHAGRGGSESDLRLAYESVGRNTGALAEELGVTRRTVQRWLKFEQGAGGEARNPAASGKARDIRALADAEREARAIEALSEAEEFDTDSVDVNYLTDDGEDEGARHAQTMVGKLNLQDTINLYRSGAPMADVGRAFANALGASYGLPDGIVISQIHGLTLR
jgi:hypothetical protein